MLVILFIDVWGDDRRREMRVVKAYRLEHIIITEREIIKQQRIEE